MVGRHLAKNNGNGSALFLVREYGVGTAKDSNFANEVRSLNLHGGGSSGAMSAAAYPFIMLCAKNFAAALLIARCIPSRELSLGCTCIAYVGEWVLSLDDGEIAAMTMNALADIELAAPWAALKTDD